MQRCQILNKESPFWLSKESLAMMSPSNLHCYCNGERNNVMGETKSKQKNPLNVFWTANIPFSCWFFFSLFRNQSSSNSRQYVRSRQSPKQQEKIRKKTIKSWCNPALGFIFLRAGRARGTILPVWGFSSRLSEKSFFCSWLHPAVLGNYPDVQNQVETVEFFVLACSQESVQCIICHQLIYCPKSKVQKNVNSFFLTRL